MLTEQRYEQILKLLEKEGSITVTEVKELLDTSESTVRRDITALHNAGKLVKSVRRCGRIRSRGNTAGADSGSENNRSCIRKAADCRICRKIDRTR